MRAADKAWWWIVDGITGCWLWIYDRISRIPGMSHFDRWVNRFADEISKAQRERNAALNAPLVIALRDAGLHDLADDLRRSTRPQ